MNKRRFFLSSAIYYLVAATFTIYSFSQVDLNLTLSSNSTYQAIQQPLTKLGYFNRPLSTIIFFSIMGLLVTCYLLLVTFHQRWKLSTKQLWLLILGSSAILLLSYPAFTHDIFNYMFDTRILLKHHANPWTMTPLDFPQDPWIRFMRWTHVSSVYPPGWTITNIPFYLAGLGKFSLTLLSFKLMGFLSFLASSWLMLRIAGQRAWIIWSFNPMVLIESLSSVHNDAIMAAFTLLAFYLLKKHKLTAYLSLVWAGLIKYVSFFLLPFLNHSTRAAAAAWVAAAGVIFIREINPWYILVPVAISIMSKNQSLSRIAVAASLLTMYRYYQCVAIFSC